MFIFFSFADALWVKVYNYSNGRSEQYFKQCNDEENIVKLWSISMAFICIKLSLTSSSIILPTQREKNPLTINMCYL